MSRAATEHPAGWAFVEASPVTTVMPGASNADGSWVELIAATAAEAQLVVFSFSRTKYANASLNAVLADLATGAAAAEVMVASGMCVGGRGITGSNLSFESITLPCRVPKGSRVSVRLKTDYSVPVDASINVALYNTSDGRIVSPTTLDTIGDVRASSKGVTIGSNDTYVEITAATAQPYQQLIGTVGNYDAAMTASAGRSVSFAVGAGGAERVVAVVSGVCSSNEEVSFGFIGVAGGGFPSGTRLAAKCSDGATNAVSVTVLGVPYT